VFAALEEISLIPDFMKNKFLEQTRAPRFVEFFHSAHVLFSDLLENFRPVNRQVPNLSALQFSAPPLWRRCGIHTHTKPPTRANHQFSASTMILSLSLSVIISGFGGFTRTPYAFSFSFDSARMR